MEQSLSVEKDILKFISFDYLIVFQQSLYIVAGADIKEMLPKKFPQVYDEKFLESWMNITNCKKPIIAAINGYAVCTSLTS